jgi:hypothetical protein
VFDFGSCHGCAFFYVPPIYPIFALVSMISSYAPKEFVKLLSSARMNSNALSFCSSTNFVRTSDESSTSSVLEPIHQLDTQLIEAARKTRFIPPSGFTTSACCQRADALLRSSPDDLGLGDILLLSNFLIKHSTFPSSRLIELEEDIHKRTSNRFRLPNMFALLQYLRFYQRVGMRRSNLVLALNTLQKANEPKISELIEVTKLILDSPGRDEAVMMDIFLALRTKFRVAGRSDPASLSPKNRANANRLTQSLFSKSIATVKGELENSLIHLSIEIMRNRNCASPEVLQSMIRFAIHYVDSKDINMALALAESIKNDQLSRWFSVEPLFESTPSLIEDLKTIEEFTNIDLDVHKHRSSISLPSSAKPHPSQESLVFSFLSKDLIFTRINPGHNERPLYQSGSRFLYYSSAHACWQVGPDPKKELLREAYINSGSDTVPLEDKGWKLFHKGEYLELARPVSHSLRKRRESVKTLIKSVSNGVDVETAGPDDDRPLVDIETVAKWAEDTVDPLASMSDEKKDRLVESLKIMEEISTSINELKDRMEEMEQKIGQISHKTDPSPTVLKRAMDSLVGAIDSLGPSPSSMVQTKPIVTGFDEMRKHHLAAIRLENQQKLVARKLRTD